MVVTGDVTQVDLPREQQSGLIVVGEVLGAIEGIEFLRFGGEDVVRHKLVQRIVEAYDEHSQREAPELRAAARPPPRLSSRRAMLEVEVFGAELAPGAPSPPEVRRLCALATTAAGVQDGHLAIEYVDARADRAAERRAPRQSMARRTCCRSRSTAPSGIGGGVERELGDVVICPAHTSDLREAIVHGVLHLVGMDHETDDGEMLALQARAAGRGDAVTRSGFVALAGRPNVGKSTLVNALVGEKVAIVSDRPQTTRRAIRGVRSAGDCQMVLVDLPGVQRPRDALTERMAQRVRQELEGCDAALMVLNGEQGVGPGDRFIAQALAGASDAR